MEKAQLARMASEDRLRKTRILLNSFSPKSDQRLISHYSVTISAMTYVVRIKKMINKHEMS